MANFSEQNPLGLTLCDLRQEYKLAELNEANCAPNPIAQFRKWFQEAQAAGLKEPNAMTLATATCNGKPSCRIVLLKEVIDGGFIFFTNYDSRKGQELKSNPRCALTFYWAELERQVRVEGQVSRVSPEKSQEYFAQRPRGSRLGALASHQSEVLPSRSPIEESLAKLEREYAGKDAIPMPEYWGGYSVEPHLIEFWQGRTNRLHDRILYRRVDPEWIKLRLAP